MRKSTLMVKIMLIGISWSQLYHLFVTFELITQWVLYHTLKHRDQYLLLLSTR